MMVREGSVLSCSWTLTASALFGAEIDAGTMDRARQGDQRSRERVSIGFVRIPPTVLWLFAIIEAKC